MADIAGVALSGVALLGALSSAIDGYLLLEALFSSITETRWLALQYGFEKHRLQCWEQEVRKKSQDGHNRLEALPQAMQRLVHDSLREIQSTHKEIEKLVTKHSIGRYTLQPFSPATRPKGPSVQNERESEQSQLKGKTTWVIRDRDRFQARVDKLYRLNSYLFESLGIESTAAVARALPVFTVATLTEESDLKFLRQHSKAQTTRVDESLVSNCASLKLLNQIGCDVDGVPSISYDDLEVDDIDRPRSLAFHHVNKAQTRRVFVEWKPLMPDLSIDDRRMVIERIKALAALLHQPKEPAFYLPSCLGLCHDGPSRYGYVFNIPSPESDLLVAPKPLSHFLDLAKDTGEKALLGERFKFAYALTSSFALLHSANWVHKGFRSNNVLFFKQWNMTSERIPLSEMHVVGFEYTRVALAGETSIETQPSSTDTEVALYQHPSVDQGYRKIFDIYSLGVVLFEIALWRPLKTKFPRNKPVTGMNAAERKSFLLKSVDILGGEVGAAYRDVVRVCLSGDFGDDSLENEALLPRAFLLKVVNVLESCRA